MLEYSSYGQAVHSWVGLGLGPGSQGQVNGGWWVSWRGLGPGESQRHGSANLVTTLSSRDQSELAQRPALVT